MKDGTMSPCAKHIVSNKDPVPAFLLGDPAYLLLPYVMKEFSGGGKNDWAIFFSYKLSSTRIAIERIFGRLNGKFGCPKRAMDININVLPQVIIACFVLHNYCEVKKEKVPEQNILNKYLNKPTGFSCTFV